MAASSNTRELLEDTCVNRWVIPNWLTLQANRSLMESQKFEFFLGNCDDIHTKWEVGLKIIGLNLRVYWKLIHAKGFNNSIKAKLKRVWLYVKDESRFSDESLTNVTVGQTTEDVRPIFRFGLVSNSNSLVNVEGALTIIITTTVFREKKPHLTEVIRPELDNYCKLARSRLCKNFAAVLEDKTSSDLKIITMDDKELFAHKIILKAQCEVFSSMFRNEFAETATGIVRVTDISAKTMKILLRYWYTGDLLPSLFDGDTIIEFTYAAGKYQMTEILEMINETFGSSEIVSKSVSNVDLQLLDLAEKLTLWKMAASLLKRITAHISKITQSQDLFTLFGWNEDSLGSEELSIENVLEIVEDLFDNSGKAAEISRMYMLLLWKVKKLSLKKVEVKLLERISNIANKASSARELIQFMCLPNAKNDNGGDLLVRVSRE